MIFLCKKDMRNIYFALIFTFLASQVKSSHTKKKLRHNAIESNHVNLSLETAFVFDPKDSYYDVTLIKTIRDFLESLEGQIAQRTQLRSLPNPKEFKLSNFVYELGRHLLKYSDEHLRSFTLLFLDVVEDFYPAETFKKLFFDPRLRSFIKNSVKLWSETEPKVIKEKLKLMYERPTYNETFTNFLFIINGFFDESDATKLFKLSKKLSTFPESQEKVKKNIEKCLSFIIFDKFRELSAEQTAVLVKEMGHLAEYVGKEFSEISFTFDDYPAKGGKKSLGFVDLTRQHRRKNVQASSQEEKSSENNVKKPKDSISSSDDE